MKRRDLLAKLKIARIGYKAAINALPYTPKDVRPYTQRTADNYYLEITNLENELSNAS